VAKIAAMTEAGDEYETQRLLVRPLGEEDLGTVLEVYTSNTKYLHLTEGSGGEPGCYDLEMLQRDFAIARMTPGRHLAGIFLKQDGEPIGVLDWMEENPSDGKPWIGLLIIRPSRQQAGFAPEAFEGLAALLRDRGTDAIRAAVLGRNSAGRGLASRLGFQLVSTKSMRMVSEEETLILERTLDEPVSE
jgi:RimJ/RimL family protein N-acetyltransferase